MTKAEAYRPGYRGVIFWGAVFLVIIYGNSLAGQFVFDDWSNIVARPELRLERITPRSVLDTFYQEGHEGRRLYRPLACLSFAINYYFGGDNPVGYHLTNLCIHLLTAFFLFRVLCLLIVRSQFIREERTVVFVAGLTTLLWAAHPLQTQAVTYVVQRMTSLATLFFTAGLYTYLRFRCGLEKTGLRSNLARLAGALLLFGCAVLSKENTIIFPVSLLLLELFFFGGWRWLRRRAVVVFGGTGLVLALLFLAGPPLLAGKSPLALFAKYEFLPFTLTQRLLTEPRVLFLYLSQLLYPVPGAFSLVHDVAPSVSLLDPPATLAALAGLLVLIGLGVVIGRKYPLVGFPIIFYFVHHLVESTILPLALVYEHRNYLPSLFFFLPLALALAYGLRVYQQRSRPVRGVLFLFTAALVFLLGLSTHIRNQDWRSSGTIWQSALGAAPGVVKPYLGLGTWYLQHQQPEAARVVLQKGTTRRNSGFVFEKADVWSRLAVVHYQQGRLDQARQAAVKSLALYSRHINQVPEMMRRKDVRNTMAGHYYFLSRLALFPNDLSSALDLIDQALAIQAFYDSGGSRAFLHNLKANYLLRLGRPEAAAAVLRQGRRLCPENERALLMLGYALTAAGEYERGRWLYQDYLRRAGRTGTAAAEALLYLAENHYLAGNQAAGDARVRQYLAGADTVQLDRIMQRFQQASSRRLPFLDPGAMRRRIQANLCRLAEAVIHS